MRLITGVCVFFDLFFSRTSLGSGRESLNAPEGCFWFYGMFLYLWHQAFWVLLFAVFAIQECSHKGLDTFF